MASYNYTKATIVFYKVVNIHIYFFFFIERFFPKSGIPSSQTWRKEERRRRENENEILEKPTKMWNLTWRRRKILPCPPFLSQCPFSYTLHFLGPCCIFSCPTNYILQNKKRKEKEIGLKVSRWTFGQRTPKTIQSPIGKPPSAPKLSSTTRWLLPSHSEAISPAKSALVIN